MSEIKLYPYQKRVASLILSGKNVILQAPTGAGKTTAALQPFLQAWNAEFNDSFPTKCIYTVPMRILAHQFVLEYEKRADSISRRSRRKLDVRIQTGEEPKDKEFEGDLIFCTIDQFLSSFLTMPYGLSRRLANLNAGAAVGSYLVFDEFHLLDPESTLPSTWYAIKQLSKVAPVLLMTATFSKSMLEALAQDLKAEIVTVPPDEAREIESRIPTPLPRQRAWRAAENLLSAEAILEKHQTRSLVLCNTVQRAQNLYSDLKQKIEGENKAIRLILLHSRFLREDRRRIENELRRLFGQKAESDQSGSVIAVATQVIEVGVDISSETLHSELAPASMLIQRAGRCARYPGEQGQVIIYPVERFTPYATDKNGAAWKEEMLAAMQWLQAHSGEVFDFDKEQAFVNAVATPRDEKVLQDLFAGRVTRRDEIIRALNGDQKASDGRLLIRDADSCRILIHPKPNELLPNPHNAAGFGVQPASLFGFFKQWQDQANELNLDWAVKMLYDPPADKKEENLSEYSWLPLNDKSLIAGARLIVVNPRLAGYNTEEGFLPHRGDTGFVSTILESAHKEGREEYSYRLESYAQHIQRVLQAFEQTVAAELAYPALALEKAAKTWRPGSVMEAARLVCALHDAGKLSQGWQKWARAHQQAIGKPIQASFAAAHTDTDRQNPALQAAAKLAEQRNPKPHHAAEGAMAVMPILFKAIEEKELAKAAVTAITRHHSPFTSEFQTYSLEASASKHITEAADFLPVEVKQKINPRQIKTDSLPNTSFLQILVTPEQEYGWLAYTLLARALRRADRMGTSFGTA